MGNGIPGLVSNEVLLSIENFAWPCSSAVFYLPLWPASWPSHTPLASHQTASPTAVPLISTPLPAKLLERPQYTHV